jgi:hypothetical protein
VRDRRRADYPFPLNIPRDASDFTCREVGEFAEQLGMVGWSDTRIRIFMEELERAKNDPRRIRTYLNGRASRPESREWRPGDITER